MSHGAFDEVLGKLKSIGTVRSAMVTKTDRTQEFRTAYAKKQELEQHLEMLAKLRDAEGTVDDFVQLEAKILAVQKDVHELKIKLGDFMAEESFCNIAFALTEKGRAPAYSLTLRLFDAAVWSVGWYVRFLCVVALGLMAHLSVRVLRQ